MRARHWPLDLVVESLRDSNPCRAGEAEYPNQLEDLLSCTWLILFGDVWEKTRLGQSLLGRNYHELSAR